MGIFGNIKTRIYCNRMVCPGNVLGITLFGLIFVRDRLKVSESLIRHEKIHCCQQLEWGYLLFFVLYGVEYLYHLARLGNSHKAYLAISFEREAYANEHDPDYLTHRRWYATFRTSLK